MGYRYNRDTDDMEWVDEGDQPLSPMEQAILDGRQDDLIRASDEYYGNPGSGAPVNVDEHPGTNWFNPDSYEWLINEGTPAPGPQSGPGGPSGPTTTTGGTDRPPGPAPRPNAPNLGSLLTPYNGRFTPPDFAAEVRNALALLPGVPEFAPPDIPAIDPWVQPGWEELDKDPGYNGRRQTGERALLNNKAAQGLARSVGTLKDLLDYNQNFASQEYGNVVNRSLTGWKTNADTTLQRSGMDQERARSIYEPQFAEYQNKVDVAKTAPQQAWDRSFKSFLTDFDLWKDQRDSVFDKLKWSSEFGLDAAGS